MTMPRDKKLTTEDVSSTGEHPIGTEAIANAGRARKEAAADASQPDAAQRAGENEAELSPLFSDETEQQFRTQWHDIQTGFVDEPRRAVEQADELVARLMQQLAQSFSDQRTSLERQWEQSDKISTEELRVALRRYRSFFERLLAI
jgi:HD-GYP domain-containing protein (c-di-GMP phosphodiesterase class II)